LRKIAGPEMAAGHLEEEAMHGLIYLSVEHSRLNRQ
jgi:hypothetical protein